MQYKDVEYIFLEENFILSEVTVRFLIKHSTNLMRYVQPTNFKKSWYNCARQIVGKGYPKNKEVIPYMFKWLQDLNWPGATVIFKYLPQLPQDVFWCNLKKSVTEAQNNKDYDWLWSLYNLIKQNDIHPLTPEDFCLIEELDRQIKKY